jgi:hypothetical protein
MPAYVHVRSVAELSLTRDLWQRVALTRYADCVQTSGKYKYIVVWPYNWHSKLANGFLHCLRVKDINSAKSRMML